MARILDDGRAVAGPPAEASGVYNGVAPEPVRNAEFTKSLAAINRPAFVPVPASACGFCLAKNIDHHGANIAQRLGDGYRLPTRRSAEHPFWCGEAPAVVSR